MLSDEFLDTARRLAAGSTEGDWRSAISRAYYACCHYFLAFLQAHGMDLSKSGQKHQTIYRSLNNTGISALDAVAKEYDELLDHRSHADYEAAFTFDQTDADDAIQRADNIIAAFEAELLNTPAATIAAGIRAYLVTSGRIRP